MITIIGPKTLTLPSTLGGDDTTYGLIVVAVTRGLRVEDVSPTHCRIAGFTDLQLVTPAIVAMAVSKGAEVTGYPAWFEIKDIDALCPFADQDPKDGEGNSLPVETWSQWGLGPNNGHSPVEVGRKWYRSSNVGASGEPLPASKWGQYVGTPADGINSVMSSRDFNAIPRPDIDPNK